MYWLAFIEHGSFQVDGWFDGAVRAQFILNLIAEGGTVIDQWVA